MQGCDKAGAGVCDKRAGAGIAGDGGNGLRGYNGLWTWEGPAGAEGGVL